MSLRAVIYARYSSLNQNEQSIEGQLRECTEYAQKHDITIVDTYIDRAMSGTNDHREQFQKMIRDSDRKLFDAVIVYKIDRFTRNRYDAAIYKARLKKNNVKVLYAKESIPDGPEGIILESLLEGMAEYYSAELSQKLRRGMRDTALKCHSTGGNHAMGYTVLPDKSFGIDPDGAAVVRQIFDLYDSGKTTVEIAKYLNDNGFKTTRNKPFRSRTIYTILHNEKYIGVYTCGDIRIEGGVPAIVDRELFDRVQKRLGENATSPGRGKAKVNYLLSGKLYCGECKSGMIGECGRGRHGTTYNYYKCSNQKRHLGCSMQPVKKEWIESLVARETARSILQQDNIKVIATRCVEINRKESAENAECELLQSKLSDTQKSIANIMKAIEMGVVTRNTQQRLQELEELEDQLSYEIEVSKLKVPNLTEDQIVFMLSQYQTENQDSPEFIEKIIDAFVDSVYLYPDRLIVTYNLTNQSGTLETSTLDLLGSEDLCSDLFPSPPPHCIISEPQITVFFSKNWLILVSRNIIR